MNLTERRTRHNIRDKRLQVRLNEAENEAIEMRAKALGMSVSAFVRAAAMGGISDHPHAEALRQFDIVVGGMEAAIDAAIRAVEQANARMESMG